jgi:hypothetical protein
MLTLLAIYVAAQSQSEPIVTPYLRKEALSIRSIRPLQPIAARYEIEEFALDLTATYDNPFDPSDVSVDAKVTAPSGASYTMPAFLYRAFQRSLSDGKEVLKKDGDPEWRLRLCPTEIGAYTVTVTVRDRTGSVASAPFKFQSAASKAHGMIGVSPRNRQYFEFTDGSSFFPIGANVCWGNDRGTFSYDDWLPAYGAVGANYLRLWLGPSWVTFAMEQRGKSEEGRGMGQFDLANAWRLDQVLVKARDNGMNAMLCIDSFNTLRAHGAYPAWDQAPQNRENGGPLRIWTDFWTNSQVERMYKAKLRYLVARYSAFRNVMSWEFWNEVDITEDYSADVVQAWHQRMGDALRGLDPYHHLVTTSLADSMGNRNLDLLPQLDYVQTHTYDSPDVAGSVLYQQARKSEWGKPHYVGEIGADSGGPRTSEDPEGLQIHDPLWMSLATGSSGTAMPWFWDNLIATKNLYPLFGAVARFTKGIDWPGEDFRRGNLDIAYQTPPKTPEWKDLAFENGPIQWIDGDSNRPRFVTIINGKVDGDLPLPGIQHGVRNHPSWHNPVRFKVNLRRATRFEVSIGDVSGYGGAILQVSLDGDPIMTREFQTGENAALGGTVSKFAGRYFISVPAGEHTVTVENVGNDWFMASYRFVGLIKRTGPPVQAWVLEGNDTVILWARQEGRTWRRVIVDKMTFPPDRPALVKLDGLSAGDWRMEIWDTWKGVPTSGSVVHVGIDGKARLPIPVVTKDLAVKLVKISAAGNGKRAQ